MISFYLTRGGGGACETEHCGRGGSFTSWQPGSERDRPEESAVTISLSRLKGLTSFYKVPPPEGSNNFQCSHRLGTEPSTYWLLREIQEPNYRPTWSIMRPRQKEIRTHKHASNCLTCRQACPVSEREELKGFPIYTLYTDGYFLSIFEPDNMVVAEVLGTRVRRRWAREFSGMRNNQSREAEAGKSTCLGREPEEVQRLAGITFRNPCGLHDAHFRDCLPTGGVTRGRHVTVPHPIG